MLQKEFLEIPSQIRLEIKLRKLRWKEMNYILHTIPKKYVIFKAKEVFCNQYFIRLLFFIPLYLIVSTYFTHKFRTLFK